MAVFTANKPVKTVTIHKDGCRIIPHTDLEPCNCGDTGGKENQRWWCEEHINSAEIDEFMNHRHWAIMICDICFSK